MNQLPNLLIVDDDEAQLIYVKILLMDMGVNLILAKNGMDALDKIEGLEIALAILDVRMPVMGGYELATEICTRRPDEKVPIIFLTANHFVLSQMYEGYSAGAVDYMFKPLDDHVFRSKVQVFLELFKQKQRILQDAELLKKSADRLARTNEALQKSEKKYRSYIDNAPDGVFVADETGKYIEVNEAACRITGYSKDELQHMSITDLLTEESMKEGLLHFNKVIKSGASKTKLLFQHKDGSHRWWSIEAVKLSEKRFLGFTKDITERKEIEAALMTYQVELEMKNHELSEAIVKAEDASRKYEELYEWAPSGFFTLSKDKTIRELNLSGSLLFNKERSKLIGLHFSSFVSRESIPVFNAFIQHLFGSKVRESCETTLLVEPKTLKYVHIEGVVVGNGKQCLLNVVDITSSKKAQEDLRQVTNFLDSIIENIPNMIFIKDAVNLRFVRFNKAGEDLLGISRERLIGSSDYDYFPKNQADSFVEKDRGVLQKKKMVDIPEELILTRQRGIRTLHTQKVPILNANGNPEYLLGISEDITELKLAEQALRISEEKYRTMLNASPDGIVLADLRGKITDVSEIGLELYGSTNKNDLVGKHFLRFIPPEEIGSIREILAKTMNEGIVQNVEMRILKKNQSLLVSEISATLIQGPDGAPFSFMIIIRDISQRKKMETKQIHADRMANLGEMASGIAHEINQPLNIISMVMDKILFEYEKTSSVDLDFLKSKADRIFENITRIRNIIDHIRAFSRNHDDYVRAAFDVNTSIDNATMMIMEQFKHLGIKLDLQLKKVPPIFGNSYQFEQVVINLLINAKDAVIDKKAKLEEYTEMVIGIRTYRENKFIIMEVEDNGIGVGKEDINNIMLPFYTTKDVGKGTGLGLSICYQIIKAMDGTIEIVSDTNSGTIIKVVMETQTKQA